MSNLSFLTPVEFSEISMPLFPSYVLRQIRSGQGIMKHTDKKESLLEEHTRVFHFFPA